MARHEGIVRLPIFTRFNGRELNLGSIEVPIDVKDGRLVAIGKPGVTELVDNLRINGGHEVQQAVSDVDIPGSHLGRTL